MAPAGPINLFFVDVKSLNNYDLMEFLTINNASHTVRAESRSGLVTSAARFSAKEETSETFGLPYFVYRHERPGMSEGPTFRIIPIKKKYFEAVKRVSKVYTKTELEGRIDHVRLAAVEGAASSIQDPMASMTTLHDAWSDLSERMRQFIFKMAKKEYAGKIDVNIEKYNEKLDRHQRLLDLGITQNEIVTALTHNRLPQRSELDPYKASLINSQLNFWNRTSATANSSAASEITVAPRDQPTVSQRSMSWDNDYDDIPLDSGILPEPVRLRIQEEDLELAQPNQAASTPVANHVPINVTELPTPNIRRAEQVTQEVHVTNHRRQGQENLAEFIHDEVDNDGLRTPGESYNYGAVGSGRPRNAQPDFTDESDQDLIDLSRDNSSNRGRPKQSVGFEGDRERGRRREPRKSQSPPKSAMKRSSAERRPRSRSNDRLRTMRDDRGYEFGARQINYSIFDDRDQDQTPTEFFRNFRVEIATNLKRGDVYKVPIPIIISLAKSCIKSKEKKKAFEREVTAREPKNINEVQKCFEEAMTISNQLRKTRFNAIKGKPPGENWADFAQRFSKQFEIAYGINDEGGANLVLMDRFQRCLSTQREMETLQMYLLMVDEKDQNVHSLAEKLEIVQANVTSKEAEKHPLYTLQSKDKPKNINCRYCGKAGHIEKECRKKMADQNQNTRPMQQNQNGCKKCGRSNHQTHECFAKTHINEQNQNQRQRNTNQTYRNNSQYQNNSKNQGFQNQRYGPNQNNNNRSVTNNNGQYRNQNQQQYSNQNGNNNGNRSYNNNRNNRNWENSTQQNQNRGNQNGYNQNGYNGQNQRQNTQYRHNPFRRQ